MSRMRFATFLFLVSTSARAGIVVVTNTSDGAAPGPAGSLRAAIAAAAGGDTIFFDASLAGQTITLTNGELAISQPALIIDGGANRITISGNRASRVVHVNSGAVAFLYSLTVRDGASLHSGGGCILNESTLIMEDSTVTDCETNAGGAGIRNVGILSMNRCTVSGNRATSSLAGGILNDAATAQLALTNCTISGNSAILGGGLQNAVPGAVAVLSYCTITENTVFDTGGGIHAGSGAAGAVHLTATVLANNRAFSSPDCQGTLTSEGDNVISSTAGCTLTGTTASNTTGVDPKLGSLLWNGGKTKTHALSPGSVAIDKVGACGSVDKDQRGLARPQDGEPNGTASCDAGAYEAARPIVVDTLGDPGPGGTCSLRQAIAAASTNATVPGASCAAGFLGDGLPDRITFGVTGKLTLAFGLTALAPDGSLLIDGPGASLLTISGDDATAIMLPLAASTARTYVFSGLTFAEGFPKFVGIEIAPALTYNGGTDVSDLAIDRCLFRNNRAAPQPYGFSSAIRVWGARQLEISRSTVTSADTIGDYAIHLIGSAAVRIADTTIESATGGILVGSSIYSNPVVAGEVVNCTLRGGGTSIGLATIVQESGISTNVALRASILAGFGTNLSAGASTVIESLGYNVSSDASGPTATGDLKSTDALLGVLAYNGGQTPTINLKPGSPAIALVPNSVFGWAERRTTVDQRGVPRKWSFSDAGAIERVIGGDVDGNGTVNVSDVLYLINYLFAGGPVPVGESDVNGDGAINVSDILYLINRLFAGGPAPI